jgi:putative PEP-CTERM system histidine kinase
MQYPIGTLTYGAAAAAFLLLSLMLLTGWRGRLQGMLLLIAVAGTAVWAGVCAYFASRGQSAAIAAGVLEIARAALWFVFLFVLLGYSKKAVRSLRLAASGTGVFCLALMSAAFYTGGISNAEPGTTTMVAHLVLAVMGIVLVEQLFRNVQPQQRWSIKYLCLGLGGMFAYDLYLYSQTLLFRGVDPEVWAARGAFDAFVVPLLAVATARNSGWSLDVSVSRGIVFHSTSMLGASLYLVAMAAVGYYIRYFGGTWGGVLQIVFVFGAALLLLALFFSGTVRARLKVLLAKHFFTYGYDYREEWLKFTRTLSNGNAGAQLRERSIHAIADLVESPAGALWLVSEVGTYEPVADWNMSSVRGSEPAGSRFCRFLQERQWVLDLTDPEPFGAPEDVDVPAWLKAVPRAWLLVPLILHDEMRGFVVLEGSKGRIRLNWEVRDLLKTAARQAASYIAQIESAQALLVARQFESFNRMSAFVVHDLKNVIAQLSLLLANADRHKHKRAFQEDVLETVEHSVDKMKRLLEQLRGTYTLDATTPVDLREVLERTVKARAHLVPAPQLVPGGRVRVMAHSARLERVFGHLVQNAIEATAASGTVNVGLRQAGDNVAVEIADSGCGMAPQFMATRLFTPFDSTKESGMGIGVYEAREYIRKLGGRIEVESVEGRGTTFRVTLPVYESTAAVQINEVAET